jgi:hypothetical protein
MDRIINIQSVTMDGPKMGDNNLMILNIKCKGSTYRILTPAEVIQVAAEGTDPKKKK